MIKKIICVLMTAYMAFTLCGCQMLQKEETEEIQPIIIEKVCNPLTGLPLAEGQIKGTRPVAVMVNNNPQAMPQRGVIDADIVYEAVTETLYTELLAVYSDINSIYMTGPVRHARDQFVQLALPLNAIYAHIGTSASARKMLDFYSYQDIDGIYVGSQSFAFDDNRGHYLAAENCWYTTKDLLNNGIVYENIKTDGGFYPAFKFADYDKEPVQLTGEQAYSVYMAYSDICPVAFTFDEATGRYYKFAYNAPHIDELSTQQLSFDNVIVITTEVAQKADDGFMLDFAFTQGEGYYFYNGNSQKIIWEKGRPENPLILRDAVTNEPVQVNPGKTYVGVLGADRAFSLAIGGKPEEQPQENLPTEEMPPQEIIEEIAPEEPVLPENIVPEETVPEAPRETAPEPITDTPQDDIPSETPSEPQQ